MVAGRRKTYQYNQYQVPLKKSDNLTCGMEVYILPQKQLEELITFEVQEQLHDLKSKHQSVAEYEKELAELEWKHNQLSKSYKQRAAEYNESQKKFEKTRKTLKSAMESIEVLKEQNKLYLKEIESKTDELREIQSKYNDMKRSRHEDKAEKKEKGFLSRFRGRG